MTPFPKTDGPPQADAPKADAPKADDMTETQNFNAVVDRLTFDGSGLIPAIAQDADNGDVLMMAWMNADAVRETLSTRRVCYWSRSRKSLWRKGETSGQVQTLVDFRFDCDGDCLLLLVRQEGVACHTGRRSCFFIAERDGEPTVVAPVLISEETLYGKKTDGTP